ncbi:uncharacterized protein METZ01_LOCUS258594, partial [marine metagenome]
MFDHKFSSVKPVLSGRRIMAITRASQARDVSS